MPLSAFPQGVSSFGIPLVGSGPILTTGKIFFVSSTTGNDGSNGTDAVAPLATLARALTLATANNGDHIILMPGHAETVVAAGGITISKAGVTIIGLGTGANRPSITLQTSTAATVLLTGSGTTIRNVRVFANVDELVKCFDIQAPFWTLDTVDFYETAAKQAISFLVTTAAGTDGLLQNCTHTQITAMAGAANWVNLSGGDRCRVLNNNMQITTPDNASSAILGAAGTIAKNILVANNVLINSGAVTNALTMSFGSSTTGLVMYNTSYTSRTTLLGTVVLGTSISGSQNFSMHTGNKNGILDPVADA